MTKKTDWVNLSPEQLDKIFKDNMRGEIVAGLEKISKVDFSKNRRFGNIAKAMQNRIEEGLDLVKYSDGNTENNALSAVLKDVKDFGREINVAAPKNYPVFNKELANIVENYERAFNEPQKYVNKLKNIDKLIENLKEFQTEDLAAHKFEKAKKSKNKERKTTLKTGVHRQGSGKIKVGSHRQEVPSQEPQTFQKAGVTQDGARKDGVTIGARAQERQAQEPQTFQKAGVTQDGARKDGVTIGARAQERQAQEAQTFQRTNQTEAENKIRDVVSVNNNGDLAQIQKNSVNVSKEKQQATPEVTTDRSWRKGIVRDLATLARELTPKVNTAVSHFQKVTKGKGGREL